MSDKVEWFIEKLILKKMWLGIDFSWLSLIWVFIIGFIWLVGIILEFVIYVVLVFIEIGVVVVVLICKRYKNELVRIVGY